MRFTKEQSEAFETILKERGYVKYVQNFKNEDFLYWKSFDRVKRGEGGYSCGIAFYDFSKYPKFTEEKCISISHEFMLGVGHKVDRLDFTVSDDNITVNDFEEFCRKFYEFYKLNNLI